MICEWRGKKAGGSDVRMLIYETRAVVDFIVHNDEKVFLRAMFGHVRVCVFLVRHRVLTSHRSIKDRGIE